MTRAARPDYTALFAGKGHKPVGKLAQQRNATGDAIVDLLRNDRSAWILAHWLDATDALYRCEDKLDDWLAIRL